MQLKYFKKSEFLCNCGCGELPQEAIMLLADQIREVFDEPLIVTSGKRCAAQNAKIGGAKKSAHVAGLAVDLAPVNKDLMDDLHRLIGKNLENWDCRMEHPDATPSWAHVDLYPVGPGGRIFRP